MGLIASPPDLVLALLRVLPFQVLLLLADGLLTAIVIHYLAPMAA